MLSFRSRNRENSVFWEMKYPTSSGLSSTEHHHIHVAHQQPTLFQRKTAQLSTTNCIHQQEMRFLCHQRMFFWQISGLWLPTTRIYHINNSGYSAPPALGSELLINLRSSTAQLIILTIHQTPKYTNLQPFTNLQRLTYARAYACACACVSTRIRI